jgi:ornithine cyclodeaminase/alanine dehydrogenase-like protein (mu-crystallin family)
VSVWVDAQELRRRLPMAAAIDALDAGLNGTPPIEVPARATVAVGDGSLLLMPATDATGAAGVKLVTLQPSNPKRGLPLVHGMYVLFAAGTLEPIAVIDGAELTAIRTGALSGLATRYLAAEDATRLVVFGAGVQARSHVDAMRAVRPISRVTVVGRSAEPVEMLVAELRTAGLDGRAGTPADVADADIVCCCTTASEPLFDGELLAPGAHVNAVGSYQLHTREIDTATVTRGRFYVDDREAVLAEAGDVQIPIAHGAFTADRIAGDLYELVTAPPPRTPSDLTVFKSVGVAWEDLIVAAAVAAKA